MVDIENVQDKRHIAISNMPLSLMPLSFREASNNNRADQKALQGLGKFHNILELLKNLMAGGVQFENFSLDVWRFKSEALAWARWRHNVDDNFLHRLVQYCEEVNKQYSTEPVVLVFVINKIRDSIMSKTTKDRKQKFLLKLSSYPWAKKCLFLNDYSIHDHLNTIPLHPPVALGAFLTAQKVSILDHDQRDDPIIQQLYGISKNVFEHVATREKTTVNDLLELCDNTLLKFQKAKKFLKIYQTAT